MLSPNIETFLGCEAPFNEARIVLYGAPFVPAREDDRGTESL